MCKKRWEQWIAALFLGAVIVNPMVVQAENSNTFAENGVVQEITVEPGLNEIPEESNTLPNVVEIPEGENILPGVDGIPQEETTEVSNSESMAEVPQQQEKNGFVVEEGKTYYYEAGKRAVGEKYIMDEVTGEWHWYYFMPEAEGEMDTGWSWIPSNGGKWCYYDENGRMMYGQQYIDGHWYLFDKNTGATQYGFVYIPEESKWVFYDRVMGWMLYGEQCIDNSWYYLTPGTGAVDYEWAWLPQKNKWVYYDPVSGIMYHGQHTIAGEYYWFDPATGESDYAQVLRWKLRMAKGQPGIHFFNGGSCSQASLRALEQAADKYWKRGYSLGYLMMDLNTGKGVSCNIDHSFYGASTIKGPYVASLYKHTFGNSVAQAAPYAPVLYNTCVNSSNEGYTSLRNRFGSAGWSRFLKDSGVRNWDANSHWVYYTPRELGKLWLQMFTYFGSGEAGSNCSSLFSHSLNSGIYYELGGQYQVRSKPGWYPTGSTATNDAGIVYAGDTPYLLVVMSNAPVQINMEREIVRCLENIHNDMK